MMDQELIPNTTNKIPNTYPTKNYDVSSRNDCAGAGYSRSDTSLSSRLSNMAKMSSKDEFLEAATKSKNPIHPTDSSEVHDAMVDRAHENKNLPHPESDMLESVSEAPPMGLEHDEMADLHKSIRGVRELLVGPAQRQNEIRLNEILSLIESHKRDNDQNLDKLRKQFAQITLKLHEKTNISLARIDARLSDFKNTVEEHRTEFHGVISTEIAGLNALTEDKIQSVSESIDARISALKSGINNDLNSKISELGRVISSISESDW